MVAKLCRQFRICYFTIVEHLLLLNTGGKVNGSTIRERNQSVKEILRIN